MKEVAHWVISNLAWMALVYGVTLSYGRFKANPKHMVLNMLGTVLAIAAATATVRLTGSTMVRLRPGSFWYHLGTLWLAALGAGGCGILLILIGSFVDEKEGLERWPWLYQLALPFYVAFFLFGGLSALFLLAGLVLPKSLLPQP